MTRGNLRENGVRSRLMQEGWLVASLRHIGGPGDLLAVKAGARPLIVEVKSTAGGPFERFGPKEREAMLDAADRFGADVALAYWPSRGKLIWLDSSAWPERLTAA